MSVYSGTGFRYKQYAKGLRKENRDENNKMRKVQTFKGTLDGNGKIYTVTDSIKRPDFKDILLLNVDLKRSITAPAKTLEEGIAIKRRLMIQ